MTFLFFHSTPVKGLMLRYSKNPYRKVIQETFKGYGKGFNLLLLVNKGLNLGIHPLYFTGVLIIRGSASAIYKQIYLSILLNKNLKWSKPRLNFIMNTTPTILVFYIIYCLTHFTHKHLAIVVERHLTIVFVNFMIVTRCIKAVLAQTTSQQKKNLKKLTGEKGLKKTSQTTPIVTEQAQNITVKKLNEGEEA